MKLKFERYLLQLVVMAWCFTSLSVVYPQTTNITGEDEFFIKQEVKRNINLGLDLGFTNMDEHYSKPIFSFIDNETFQIGFVLRGYFPITRKLTARFCLPYLVKVGLEDDEKYPNAAEPFPGLKDYLSNDGLGDIFADVNYAIMTQDEFPINLVTQLTALFATGESRFHSSFNGYLPLGNGFHSIGLGSGISRRLSYKTLVFTSAGYTMRFPRKFKPTVYNSAIGEQSVKFKPGGVFFLRAGFGFRFFFLNQWQIFNVETEYISPEQIELDAQIAGESNVAESAFHVARIGVKFISRREKGESTTIFIGWEKAIFNGNHNSLASTKDNDSFVLVVTIPMALKFLNFNFD